VEKKLIFLPVIFLFFCCVYTIVIVILSRGLQSLRVYNEKEENTFSVVIAARNEQAILRSCLDSILQQTISTSRYEVVLVNDRSTDNTLDIANEYAAKYPNFIVRNIETVAAGVSPKKNAVSQGVGVSSKEIIVFTDADCVVPPEWLATINQTFTASTGLVQGITRYAHVPEMNQVFWGLQSLDFLSHGIVAAAAIGAGIPLNSNANNFAFRKDAFLEIGGYGRSAGNVVSGDDDLLLQKIWKSKKWAIRFMINDCGLVSTLPTNTIKGVFEQRKRWGSKTVHYNAIQVAMLSGIFLFYLSIIISFCIAVFSLPFLYWGLGMIALKVSGEASLLIPGTRIFKQKNLRCYIIPASLIQLPMVVGAVFLGVFGKFNWKDQKFSRKIRR
jgi:cellulose synthase/poly-beta-1,6-N-acetylglucosamine synthase-like glycosyltransferase